MIDYIWKKWNHFFGEISLSKAMISKIAWQLHNCSTCSVFYMVYYINMKFKTAEISWRSFFLNYSQPPPSLLPLSGLAKKLWFWKRVIKGVSHIYYIYNQKNILGSRKTAAVLGEAVNGGTVLGGRGQRRGGIGGDGCIRACPHYAWWRRATWRGPSGVVCLELPPVGVETLGE